MSQNQSKYMKTWTDAYAEVRSKTEEQMGPTGVVLELSHEDWEKMQKGATLDELKTVKEFGIDGHAEKQRWNTGDNEKRDKVKRAKERLRKAEQE